MPYSSQVYAAAKSMLGSSKLPVKMAGVSLSAALYAAEGSTAKTDLGFDDMESRIKAQVNRERELLSEGRAFRRDSLLCGAYAKSTPGKNIRVSLYPACLVLPFCGVLYPTQRYPNSTKRSFRTFALIDAFREYVSRNNLAPAG